MRDTPEASRRARRRVPVPRWLLAALPVCIVLGVVIGLYATDVPRAITPPKGPPDTLHLAGGVAIPRPPPVIQAPYLARVVEKRKSPREVAISELALRYNVTETLARLIYDVAVEEGIDPELGFRLVRVESVFDPNAIGTGAVGLCQLMPGTARDIDPEVDTRKELLDPRTNLHLGFTNLRNMIELFDGDVRLGVIAYNRGEVAVQRALRRGRDPENGYGERVLGPRAHGGKRYTGRGLIPRQAKSDAGADTTQAGN
ncbi:MAG TPA: transglycosylase SLT domain-containing protein [Longimicrobiaceae bacterium]|nr:transglycosylase SLT domain-containing protein [Longimicrobiaceae bacterium]